MSVSRSHETEAHKHPELGFVRKYVFSTDHKIIGIQFLFSTLIFLCLGGLLALGVRLQLGWPHADHTWLSRLLGWPSSYGNHMPPEFYNILFSMHATIMIFFVIIPLLAGAFGNFTIPLMIGAKDMAFPALNMMSYWFMWPAFVVILSAYFVSGGAPGQGWTAYPTLSSAVLGMGQGLESPSQPNAGVGQMLWLIALLLVGVSSM